MAKKKKPTPTKCVSVTAATHARLTAQAKQEGVTVAKLIERALDAQGAPVVERPTTRNDRGRLGMPVEKRPSLERVMLGDVLADRMGFQ